MRVALPGALLKRRAGGGKARRMVRMDANQFVVSTGCAVDKPRNPAADLARRDARKARKRGAPLYWLLSLGQARESDSPFEGGRKLLAF